VKRIIVPLATFVAAATLLAFNLGGGERAHAAPTHIMLVNPGLCLAAASPPITSCLTSVGFEYTPSVGDKGIAGAAAALGKRVSFDDLYTTRVAHIEPSDFQGVATFSGGQVHQLDGNTPTGMSRLAVIAFVDHNAPVTFKTTAGFFSESDNPTYTCRANDPVSNPDTDCGSPVGLAVPATPDGVVVAYLACTLASCPTLGPQQLTVEQDGIVYPMNFTVVGEPHTVSFFTLETGIQAGVANDATGKPDCPFSGTLPFITKALGEAEKTVIVARAHDLNDTAIVGAWFNFTSSDTSEAVVALPQAPTLDLGGFGLGAPNIVCAVAGAKTGSVTIKAQLTRFVVSGGEISVDPQADPGRADSDMGYGTFTFTVADTPAKLALAADPPSLNCDGTATSKVSATVIDAEGNPAVSGTAVNFSVQTLGTADPISAMTDDKGVATSTIAPLAGDTKGVTVDVSVLSGGVVQPNAEQSIVVQCTGAAPAGAAAAGAGAGTGASAGTSPAPTGIHGPDTGSAGLLGGTHALSWWPALALAVAAFALASVRLATKRR
jgi:hypothetical protein